MKIMIRKSLALGLVLGLLVFALPVGAGQQTQKYFDAYNVSSASYVYDSTGSAASTAGWINVKGLHNKAIVVNVTTINATSLDIRIEAKWDLGGLSSNGTVSGEVFSKSYTTTTAVGDIIVIPEGGDYLRVGLQVTGDAGAQSITISLVEGT